MPIWAFICLFISSSVMASNLWEEDRIAGDIEKTVQSQEINWLKTDSRQPAMALYKESTQAEAQGAIILMHNLGYHPNWPQVIRPLRQELPEHGWHTLSFQMPIPDKLWQFTLPEDIYELSKQRLEAAIKLLRQKNVSQLVLLAHGESAALATQYLSQETHPFTAYIAVSMSHNAKVDDWRNVANSMKSLRIATLDIFAEHDVKTVVEHTNLRLAAARIFGENMKASPTIPHSQKVRQLAKNKTNNLWYRQIAVNSAMPDFPNHQATLSKYIRGWLKHYATEPPEPVENQANSM